MRPTIVLISAVGTHKELVDRLRHAGTYSEGEFFDRLERGTCSFGIDLSGDVGVEFEEDEITQVSRELGEFGVILIEYFGMPCLRQLLLEVLQGFDGLLDTNYGDLIRYDRVLERLRRDPSWDWASQ